MTALEPVTFRDLIDAIATLPVINFPENSSQLNSNKREQVATSASDCPESD